MERDLNGRSHGVWGGAMRTCVGLNVVVVFSEFDLCARSVADRRESARSACKRRFTVQHRHCDLARRTCHPHISYHYIYRRKLSPLARIRSGARFLITCKRPNLPVLLYPVYRIQPVVKPDRFDNRFDNRVERTATVRSTGCQTGLTAGLTTSLTTGCIVYTNI